MRCPHCNARMRKTDEVIQSYSRQTWYQCSDCGGVQTVSEPTGTEAVQRIGNRYRFRAQSRTWAPGSTRLVHRYPS